MSHSLPPSLVQVLHGRGFATPESIEAFLAPSLDALSSPDAFPDMEAAVGCLRTAIKDEQPIAIYADRDVDGLSGLAILLRTLRTLGAQVIWGSPLKGRGVERAILESLIQQKARIVIFVDCGTSEEKELRWLADQGMDVIVADHHRLSENRPPALAWIHPEAGAASAETQAPAGCVMAFKLAQALWLSFLGSNDPERMDYFLFDHLDLLCLGILADRVPLTGENRTFVWHGLRRLARTRKTGLAALLRFFRLTPRPDPISVREATWQIVPLLNAAGRLRQPQWAANLLTTEEPWTARLAIDALIGLNAERRSAQDKSLSHFEKIVAEQCSVDTDSVLVAMAQGLEPSVTGLAAQSLVKRYGRPAFLFVDQGEEAVGSARGTPDIDLFAWAEEHSDLLVKFGGHHGAVGLTIRTTDFDVLRGRLLKRVNPLRPPFAKGGSQGGFVNLPPEGELSLKEADSSWWEALQRLEPFGPGFPMPAFRLTGIEEIRYASKRNTQNVILKAGSVAMIGELPHPPSGHPLPSGEGWGEAGPWTVVAYPERVKKQDLPFKWMITGVQKNYA